MTTTCARRTSRGAYLCIAGLQQPDIRGVPTLLARSCVAPERGRNVAGLEAAALRRHQ
ncbi:hypothetical protein OEIGOIKO_00083 [Streptomyces chrestomyceticus JCM 4735]|uniref:Uncharacterized protein n=1 Tax=Streptomyces chrestomyceticus JCM 4735 TaxID=1306181 RepID=A0A7U9KPG2_9ACTN|nr:hypothetical protein [Streptomyces chrestomyceticus]GCD32371.1 hypothetical protein OEIGOIKO_00083 [Streptomyces chrestomyceticus JCM 4735]